MTEHKRIAIVFDTETTGLLKPESSPLSEQPQIIEFAGIKIDFDTMEEIDRLEFFVNPGIKLPDKITEITHITDAMLAGQPKFAKRYPELCRFFLGTTHLIAHNLAYDRDMLKNELLRLGKGCQFPWPAVHICTCEGTKSMHGYRLNLTKLHQEAFGEAFDNAHRAMGDVEALLRCVKWLRTKEML